MFSSPSALTKKSCRIQALRAVAETSKAQRGGGLLISGHAMSSKFWRERQGGPLEEEHPRSQIALQTPLGSRGTSPVAGESDPEDALGQKVSRLIFSPQSDPALSVPLWGLLRPPLDVPKGTKRGVGGTHKRTESHVGPHSSRSRRTGIHLSQKRRPFIYILARTTIASV